MTRDGGEVWVVIGAESGRTWRRKQGQLRYLIQFSPNGVKMPAKNEFANTTDPDDSLNMITVKGIRYTDI